MKRKGFYPMYTILGLVLVLIVITIALQLENQSTQDFSSHIDRLTWLKINHAVDNTKTIASDSLKGLFHEAIMDTGKIKAGTLNQYLNHSKEVGWSLLVDDVRMSVSNGFDDVIPKLADYSDGYNSVFSYEDGINITLGQIEAGDIDIRETEDGMVAIAKLPMAVSSNYHGWEALVMDTNVTIPLDVRLKDMYERAWDFNQNYENIATWTFTAAIYARAYIAAYNPKASGAFLLEGHYDYDPIAVLLFGDLDTVKEFAGDADSVLDVGAIPAATWLAEWQYLSEPSFLPAGFDLEGEDKEKTVNAITANYNTREYEEGACENETLTVEQKEDCEKLYDPDKLEEEVANLREKKEVYENLLEDIEDWLDDYDTEDYDDCGDVDSCKDDWEDRMERVERCEDRCSDSEDDDCMDYCRELEDRYDQEYDECKDEYEGFGGKEKFCEYRALNKIFGGADTDVCDDFRNDASSLINGLMQEFDESDESACQDKIEDARDEVPDDLNNKLEKEFEKNADKYGFSQTDDYCDGAMNSVNKLKNILETKLQESVLADGLCLDDKEEGDCITNRDCGEAGDCDGGCDFLRCRGGKNYDCIGDLETGDDWTDSCKEGHDTIDECTCRCRPSAKLVKSINQELENVRGYVEKTATALEKTYDVLNEQLENKEKIDELRDMAESLEDEKVGYDVFARIDPEMVKFDTGTDGWKCYMDPSFEDKDKGVCGDSIESASVYTIQIAAAALAAVFSGGAATPLLDYAKDFFPLIFESEVKYALTETLIDDGNRVILKNVAGEGGELYTYAAFEFEIYKGREFDIKSATLDRTIVYLYLPVVKRGMERAIEGMTSCEGEECE